MYGRFYQIVHPEVHLVRNKLLIIKNITYEKGILRTLDPKTSADQQLYNYHAACVGIHEMVQDRG